MSISKLRVYLDKAFGAGMVYVALSRCVSLDGLQVSAVMSPFSAAVLVLLHGQCLVPLVVKWHVTSCQNTHAYVSGALAQYLR